MDETVLLEKAHALAARERATRAARAAARATLPGAALALGLTVLLKAMHQPAWQGLLALALLPAGSAVKQYLRRTDPTEAAYAADRALDLQERLGTATEWLLSDRPRTLMAQVMLKDAAAHAETARPEQAFPYRLPQRTLRQALLLTLLTVALAAAPNPQWLRPNAEAVAVARQQAEQLERDVQGLPETAEVKDLKARIDELQQSFQQPDLDPRDALERIAALDEELQRLGDQKGQAGSRAAEAEAARQLREAARQLARQGDNPQIRAALERLAADPGASEAQREAARSALQALERRDVDGARQQCEQGATQGQQGQGQQGQGQPGQQGQAQSNQGQRTTQTGETPTEGDFGRGSTMENAPSQPQDHDFVLDRQSDHKADWTEEYRRLHPPDRSDVDTADVQAGGDPGAGRTLPMQGEGLGAPSQRDAPATRPAGDAYVQVRQDAENAVARDEIPARRKDLVRSYFEGIDPRR